MQTNTFHMFVVHVKIRMILLSKTLALKVVTNEKGEASGAVLTIRC